MAVQGFRWLEGTVQSRCGRDLRDNRRQTSGDCGNRCDVGMTETTDGESGAQMAEHGSRGQIQKVFREQSAADVVRM
jgi:hypothetical protein